MCARTMQGEKGQKIGGDLNERKRDETRRCSQRKRREMKGERRDDKEAERKGDIPLGGRHR